MEEIKRCPYCDEKIAFAAKKCKHCGEWLNNTVPVVPPIIINNQPERQVESPSNKLGTSGFVLSLLGVVLCWIPVANYVLWLLGLIFSFVGVFRAPRGLAIAGLVLSSILLIVLIFVIGAIATLIGGAAL
jgi:hypothetical protein